MILALRRKLIAKSQSHFGGNSVLNRAVGRLRKFRQLLECLMSAPGLVSRALPVQTAMRNCTRDEGGPFEVGNQVLTSSHRKLLSSKAMVVLCQEGARAPCCTRDEGGPFGAVL